MMTEIICLLIASACLFYTSHCFDKINKLYQEHIEMLEKAHEVDKEIISTVNDLIKTFEQALKGGGKE